MSDSFKFTNPPITEALLDIRTTLPKETNLEILAAFQDIIKSEYPIKKERRTGEFQIATGANPTVISSSDRVTGYLFQSSDAKKIVQARLDGFTFNKLKPYSDWPTFSTEAKSLWQHYLKIAKPTNTLRLALRYINRIELPLPFSDFKEYILTVPEVAPGMPNGLSGFFMQLVIPNLEIESTALVTVTIESKAKDQSKLPLIFDIDVSRNIVLKPDSEEIWSIMDKLRAFKNQVFMNSFTEKTKELFK